MYVKHVRTNIQPNLVGRGEVHLLDLFYSSISVLFLLLSAHIVLGPVVQSIVSLTSSVEVNSLSGL